MPIPIDRGEQMGIAVALFTFLGSLVLIAGRRRRWRIGHAAAPEVPSEPRELSPVARQHLHLMHGGLLSRAAVDRAKSSLQDLLDQGRITQAASRIGPGLDFIIQVRALTEIGSDDACRILEQQLQRRLSSDPVEQSWYLVDLAHSLRNLHRPESLTLLLQRSTPALNLPLSHLFAAEVVCFDGFEEYLDTPFTIAGRQATRILLRALEGVRRGLIPLDTLVEAHLGEMADRLVSGEDPLTDGLLIRVAIEAARLARRTEPARLETLNDPTLQEGLHWQQACLQRCDVLCRERLARLGRKLPRFLQHANRDEQRDLLLAMAALRVDGGAHVLALLDDPTFPHRAEAIAALAWCEEPKVRMEFQARASQWLLPHRRSWWRHRQTTIIPLNERLAIIQALRRQPSLDSERLLLNAALHGEPELRPTALAALGWWEPIFRREVIACLKQARQEGNSDIRQRARAALARLGERQALQELHYSLTDADPVRRKATIELVADEGLTWFWSELDRLTEADDHDLAYHAREALERLREDTLGTAS